MLITDTHRSTLKVMRYAMATIGPIGSGGAQFLLSFVLLRLLDTSSFGSFSFLLIASQFNLGIWSALFCAPLPVLLTTGNAASRSRLIRGLFTMNLLGAIAALGIFWLIGIILKLPVASAGMFGAYSMFALLRWFARSHAYAVNEMYRTVASDLVLSSILLIGVASLTFWPNHALQIACGALLMSAMIGMLPFGRAYLIGQFTRCKGRDLIDYAPVWMQHARWAVLGVLTTEATANCHAYILTFMYGPGGFAPIAASALLMRPINLAMNALSELERSQMARHIGGRRIDHAMAAVRFFRYVLMTTWVLFGICITVLFLYAPRFIFPAQYDLTFLVIGSILWMAVTGMRLLRTSESLLLQAAGAFRSLAFGSVISSGVSIAMVIVLLAVGGQLWSIVGILGGETIFAAWTWRQARQWQADY